MSELWGPGEQLGLHVRASALGRRGWICWPKRQNYLPVLWRGEPEPVAVCRSGSRLGRVGTWQPFSVANLSPSD